MEFRKIVKSGNTSYVISIPREWVKENEIKKGDLVCIEEDNKKNLIISPKEIKIREEPKEIKINVDEMSDETLARALVSCYINGYSEIEVIGKKVERKTDFIRKKVEQLIAFEIMEYTPTKMVIKDYAKVGDVSLQSIIRKIDFTIKTMMREILSQMKEVSSGKCSKDSLKNLVGNVYDMDQNVNRLNFLGVKIIRSAFNNPSIEKMLNLKPIQLLVLYNMTTTLENLADNLKNLARVLDTSIPRNEFNYIERGFEDAIKNYEDAMSAYFNENKELSHRASDAKHAIRERNKEFLTKKIDCRTAIILERIQAIESFIGIILRTVIDIV